MFIYYYVRLTTGRVLFFPPSDPNTENPPTVDNRNIHHNIYSFPIDTFAYFCADDKKKSPKVLSARFSAIFPPLIVLFGDYRPVRDII